MSHWVERWEREILALTARVARLVFRAAVVFALIAGIGLGALWAAHRWLAWSPPAPLDSLFAEGVQQAEPLLYVYDNDMGWKLRPYTQIHFVSRAPFARTEPQDVRMRTNSEGFFDREHYLATDYYRIAFLGDSWVEAYQVDQTLRFTDLVEGYVHSLSGGAKAVETMNFGVGNLGPAQEFGLARKYVAKYKPNEIWLVFNPANDIADSTQLFTAPPLGPTYVFAPDDTIQDVRFGFVHPPTVNEALRRKRYGEWVNLTAADVMPYLYARETHPAFDAAMRETRGSLRLLKRLCDSMGTRLVVAYLPARFEIDRDAWEKYERSSSTPRGRAIHLDASLGEARVAEMARGEGADFFSLKPLLAQKGPREMLSNHLSRMGHHWVADAIARRLIASDCCALPASAAEAKVAR